MSAARIPPPADKLTRREREIMNAVFALGNQASAEDIRERLTNPPGYSAVRAMLVRLEAKGHLRHQEDGKRYVFIGDHLTSHRQADGAAAVPCRRFSAVRSAR